MVLFTIKHPYQDHERKKSLTKNWGEKIKHDMDGMKGSFYVRGCFLDPIFEGGYK